MLTCCLMLMSQPGYAELGPDPWPLQGARGVPVPAADHVAAEGIVRAMHRLRIFVLVRVWNELRTLPRPGQLGGPDVGLSWQQTLDFAAGRLNFQRVFTAAEGLGPHYNQVSCASCHRNPVMGGDGDRLDLRIHVRAPDRDPNDTVSARMYALPGVSLETKGKAGQRRRTPPLFGLGRLDAIANATLEKLADPTDRDGDGVRGKLNHRSDKDGERYPARFGHKSNDLTLLRFHAGALQGEMGITNGLGRGRPRDTDAIADPEVPPRFVVEIDAYVRGLAPPAPLPPTPQSSRGAAVFRAVGCAVCHRPVLGVKDPVRGAYTDMLLHDVGPKLSDGLRDAQAGPSDWRTPPLWGLRHRAGYLHDQRTTSLKTVIALHGGEASRSVRGFNVRSTIDQAALLAFLRRL